MPCAHRRIEVRIFGQRQDALGRLHDLVVDDHRPVVEGRTRGENRGDQGCGNLRADFRPRLDNGRNARVPRDRHQAPVSPFGEHRRALDDFVDDPAFASSVEQANDPALPDVDQDAPELRLKKDDKGDHPDRLDGGEQPRGPLHLKHLRKDGGDKQHEKPDKHLKGAGVPHQDEQFVEDKGDYENI